MQPIPYRATPLSLVLSSPGSTPYLHEFPYLELATLIKFYHHTPSAEAIEPAKGISPKELSKRQEKVRGSRQHL